MATKPFLVLYVAWHPNFSEGHAIAKALYDHYRRDVFNNVTGGIGLSVQYRFQPGIGLHAPMHVDFDASHTTAVVILADDYWVNDPDYKAWDKSVRADAANYSFNVLIYPIAFADRAFILGKQQAFRWYDFDTITRGPALLTDLNHQMCRMLRWSLLQLQNPSASTDQLTEYLRPVEVFISHTKHDDTGIRIATLVRDRLNSDLRLESFFDVYDIPTGVDFDTVLLHKVKSSAVIAIYSDAYSTREWCRKEVLEAKKYSVPLVVASCLSDRDERSFPYMGNHCTHEP